MANVVDSSGWIEYFADGPNADFFAPIVEDTGSLVVPSITLYEVFKRLLVEPAGEEAALEVVAAMQQGLVVALSPELALAASKISSGTKLPMADSVILATAREHDAALWTQNSDFEGVEDVRYTKKA